MFLMLGKTIQVPLYVLGLVIAITLVNFSTGEKYEHDGCKTHEKSDGICRVFQDCQNLIDDIRNKSISIYDLIHCGFKGNYELVCCPIERFNQRRDLSNQTLDFGSKPEISTMTTTRPPTTPKTSDRPAAEACRLIKDNLGAILTPHVLDGTPVSPGEYPHMAAIGYATGNQSHPYNFDCGGILIHERFVLTAAHCITIFKPAIVRLGMSNFDDAEELVNKYEVPIKEEYIHPKFSRLNKIHDIALLEFEKPVPKNRYISPTCLYTDNENPPADAKLYVAGWGVYNYTSKFESIKSNALQKARMYLVSDQHCRRYYWRQGIRLQPEQMCAYNPNYTSDACGGDSGGPLLLHVDEGILDFSVVGIIVGGYSCAGSIPGLYMRVSMYLDWIESIVWPSN